MKSLPQLTTTSDLKDVALPPCVDRRAFLGHGGLLAVAAVLASACGDGLLGGSGSGAISKFSIKTGDYPALATVGGITRVSGASAPVAVVRVSTGTYRAFSMICPHQGTTISIVSGGFICPNHEAQFSSTGAWRGGQPTSSLQEYTVVVDATTGTLTIS
jgi:nitrite reductase/ring-hydroxylating ferredoxin subunit